MRRSDGGSVLLLALVFVVLATLALNELAVRATRLQRDGLRRDLAEAARTEARGGVRWGAARLAAGDAAVRLEREDPDGRLEVVVHGRVIVSTYALRTHGGPIERRVQATWSPGGLTDWRER